VTVSLSAVFGFTGYYVSVETMGCSLSIFHVTHILSFCLSGQRSMKSLVPHDAHLAINSGHLVLFELWGNFARRNACVFRIREKRTIQTVQINSERSNLLRETH
jgi:hypothetical protein